NMNSSSAETTKSQMIEKMGHEFGSMFFVLYNEISWLTFQWIEFKELYGSKESRIELMNEAAPFFFYTVQHVLWYQLLLGGTRLTDPPKSGSNKNITFRAIPQYIKDDDFKSEIENDLEELLAQSNYCRVWRNQKISHLDHALAIQDENARPLETASREKFRITLEKMQILFKKIHQKYLPSAVRFDRMTSSRGAISLLHKIEAGIWYDESIHQLKLEGKWNKDYEPDSRV